MHVLVHDVHYISIGCEHADHSYYVLQQDNKKPCTNHCQYPNTANLATLAADSANAMPHLYLIYT
jgi:hypothetical protein